MSADAHPEGPLFARWWRVVAGVLALGALACAVAVPFGLAEDRQFQAAAREVSAVVTDLDCAPACTNELRFTLDGVEHRVVQHSWNREVGSTVAVLVDPGDPSNLRLADQGTGNGTLLALAAVVLGAFAATTALRGVDRPRWWVPLVGIVGAGLAVGVATRSGATDLTGVVAVVVGALAAVGLVAGVARLAEELRVERA